MTRQEIEIKIKRVIAEQLAIEEERVKPESVIALGLGSDTDLCSDSLDVVEIIMALEEEFDFNIYDHEIEDIKTVKDLVDFVESHS